jgi:methionyl aminopeptidase
MIEIKTPEQIELMRRAGLVVARTLERLTEAVRPGVTTADLDKVAEESIRDEGATSNFLGYHGFPGRICTSVNDQIVHGIPSPSVVLREGDVISIDCGAIIEGFHGDAAVTVPVGEISHDRRELLRVTEASLWHGMAAARLGGRLIDISRGVETYIRSQPHPAGGEWGIVEEYVGHGIGTAMHQEPQVHNFVPPRAPRGPRLTRGLALAIEPMVNLGTRRTRVLDDGWTVVTGDGAASAHFEHSFTLTDDGPFVLTAVDGGAARFAAMTAGERAAG